MSADWGSGSAAAADVRSAIPSAEAYYSDCNTYADSTAATDCSDGLWHKFLPTGTGLKDGSSLANAVGLDSYDSGIKLDVAFGNASKYCLSKTVNQKVGKVLGPGGTAASTDTTVACTSATA